MVRPLGQVHLLAHLVVDVCNLSDDRNGLAGVILHEVRRDAQPLSCIVARAAQYFGDGMSRRGERIEQLGASVRTDAFARIVD